MAWISREWVNRNLIGLLAVLGIVLAVWLLWQWLLIAVAIVVPCVVALLWVSKAKKAWPGQVGIRQRRDADEPKRLWRRRDR